MVATNWGLVLKEAEEARIPASPLDRPIDVRDRDPYMTIMTANNVLEGRLIGSWLAKTVSSRPRNVVEPQDTIGADVATDHKRGFVDAIAEASSIRIIHSQSGDFTRNKGKKVMESSIKTKDNGKSICMVFTYNDDMMIGTVQAIRETGLKPGKDIPTDSIGGVPDIYKTIIVDEANASVELTPGIASPTFGALEKCEEGDALPEELTITKSTLCLSDTAREELEEKKSMSY